MDAMTKEAESRLKTLAYIARIHRDMERIQEIQGHLLSASDLLSFLDLTGIHCHFFDGGMDMVPEYVERVKRYAGYASDELKNLYDVLIQTENRINEKYRERAFKKVVSTVTEEIPF